MRNLVFIFVAFTLLAGACSSSSGDDPSAGGSDGGAVGDDAVVLDPADIRLASRLTPFNDCGDLLSHIQAEAAERVGPYGLDLYGYGYFEEVFFEDDVADMDDLVMEEEPMEEAAFDAASSADGDSAGSQSAPLSATSGDSNFQKVSDGIDAGGDATDEGEFTGTNVQELGIDEPDIIKTDGDRILVVNDGLLSYIDLSNGDATRTDQLRIPEGWGHELFFQGNRALLFTNGGNWVSTRPLPARELTNTVSDLDDAEADFATEPIPVDEEYYYEEYYGPAAMIIEIDLSDPANLEITSSMRIEGQYLSARAVGSTVRMALTTGPQQLEWVYPSNPAGEDRATRFNRELIEETTIEDWIPEYSLTTGDSTKTGPLLACDRLHRPAEFSGFDIVSVLSFDLDDGIDPGDGVGVLASGQTVYASQNRFYVATTQWAGTNMVAEADVIEEWTENYTTDVHAFSIAVDEPANYVASGAVDGTLLNQFSMGEHEGYLRIFTTEGSPWDRSNLSETQLVVLEEQDDVLAQVGQVGGLGEGESLYSARLVGDTGFAVTFRQIDPFYVLDLSDPTNPIVSGELKIPGVSTYLHPLGGDRVVGVGQDATEDGATTGLKMSLFDVSDPSDPRELAVWKMPNANSPAEWDHRAFQIIGDTVILPVQSWNGGLNGAVLLEVGDETITEVGQVSHIADEGAPSSDCEQLTSDQFSQETELWWIAQDGHVQLCDANDAGGWGSWYCDIIPVEEIRYWFGDEDEAGLVIAELGADADDRFEICWADGGNWDRQIQRSLVIDDTLWTMSWNQLQANDLSDLAVDTVIGLR